MEMGGILQALGVVWSVLALAAAAVVVGSRRGLRESSVRLATEQAATIAAMSQRIDSLVAENERLTADLAKVRGEVAALRQELDTERRITLRMRPDAD